MLLLISVTPAILGVACKSYQATRFEVLPILRPGPEIVVDTYRVSSISVLGFPFGTGTGPPVVIELPVSGIDIRKGAVVQARERAHLFFPMRGAGYSRDSTVWRLSLPDRVWTQGPPHPDPGPYPTLIDLAAIDRDRVAVVLKRRRDPDSCWIVSRRADPRDTWIVDIARGEWRLAAEDPVLPVDRRGTLAEHEGTKRGDSFEFRLIRGDRKELLRIPAVGDSTSAAIRPVSYGDLYFVELRRGTEIAEVAVSSATGPIGVVLGDLSAEDRKRLLGR